MTTKKTRKKKDPKPPPAEAESNVSTETKIEDPIGDETDGEAAVALGPEAEDSAAPVTKPDEDQSEPESSPRPPAQLERLQKILAKAGVASRRKAEEMIVQGRVQVNGKVVTVLGAKADAGRDHIRVDGKLLQGSERLRYFMLNKPRGFVTTVKDPEGRPTVMQFFEKINERLYPVGRLDYMSEGLLLVTNDGELANRLTRAAAGVEKTYLVKVAGQPTEAELNLLRGGVSIERGKPGSGQVRTSPARIRQVRQGDNPWYEVVLIEGRNRELRKMFEEVGHFVEKIRRVGYGPLVLDQEPGNLRELKPEELAALRQAAEGKLRTPKSKELRRRNAMDAAGLPTVTPRPTIHPRPSRPFVSKSFEERPAPGPKDYRAKKFAGAGRPSRPPAREFGSERRTGSARPAWKKEDRPSRPPARFASGATGDRRPYAGRSGPDKSGKNRPPYAYPAKPAWKKPETQQRPPYKRQPVSRPAPPQREADEFLNTSSKKPSRLQIEPIEQSERPSSNRPSTPRPRFDRSSSDRPSSPRPSPGRFSASRSGSARPFKGEGALSRPFTTSSGKPRAGGARSSNKPYSNSGTRDDRMSGPGWKPKTRYGGSGKPASGGSSKSGAPADRRVPSGQSVGWKSAYKGKPSGPRRSGAPGGKKRR